MIFPRDRTKKVTNLQQYVSLSEVLISRTFTADNQPHELLLLSVRHRGMYVCIFLISSMDWRFLLWQLCVRIQIMSLCFNILF